MPSQTLTEGTRGSPRLQRLATTKPLEAHNRICRPRVMPRGRVLPRPTLLALDFDRIDIQH
ncbi:hypothetical protein DDT46_00545 [Mycobacteroides abscessus]|nr:hypothetical protein DDT46_00545 [Mycobacteroides abscessus]